jgi:hypothetical protein
MRWSIPLKIKPPHKQNTGVHKRSTAEYGRSVGSACTAEKLSGRCTSPSIRPNLRVRSQNVVSPLIVPALDTINCRVRRQALEASWSLRPQRSCQTPWTHMPRVSIYSRTSSSIYLSRFLTSRLHNEPPGQRRCENTRHVPIKGS